MPLFLFYFFYIFVTTDLNLRSFSITQFSNVLYVTVCTCTMQQRWQSNCLFNSVIGYRCYFGRGYFHNKILCNYFVYCSYLQFILMSWCIQSSTCISVFNLVPTFVLFCSVQIYLCKRLSDICGVERNVNSVLVQKQTWEMNSIGILKNIRQLHPAISVSVIFVWCHMQVDESCLQKCTQL